ncbi:hypothetical protein [Acinetobacter tandoii]|uniref:Uncharacterized protein n=1 Tax=Acinetobacter tandoii DSM 14970 = CIP 107469 TaxID=1120927 RepID=R9AWR0_9GAMM|nr:hypothetical protein [Acinetobacter tandoii]EOR06455.1 hypothetical protein I593_02322 [Acinetobacter tandoii DSM 14970 = CIP 107469]
MSLENPTKLQLSEVALSALVNSLKLHGHDLDQIFKEYENQILDNKISGANANWKFQSTDHLKSYIDEAKKNPIL